MMRHLIFRRIGVTLGFFLLLAGGCGGMFGKGTQQPTRFYQLTSTAVSEPDGIFPEGEDPIEILLEVDQFPEYLKRTQIVTLSGNNKVERAKFHHWAEPLQRNFPRVLAVNLANDLRTARIYLFPWRKARSIDYELLVDVLRFEGELGGEVVLIGRWSLYDRKGKNVLVSKSAKFTEPAGARDYEAQVAAMSRTVADLSLTIAESIKGVPESLAAR